MQSKITKTQKIIIAIAMVLVIATFFFPFYWEGQFGDDHKLIRIYLKWGIDPNLLDCLRSSEGFHVMSGSIVVGKFGTVGFKEYFKRRDIQLLEIIVIFILAAAGFQVAKKDVINGGKHGKIKAQKVIILATAFMITLSILFPPCDKFISSSKTGRMTKQGIGWAWLLRTKDREFSWAYKIRGTDVEFRQIQYAVLAVEIIGILVLAGAAYLAIKRANRN